MTSAVRIAISTAVLGLLASQPRLAAAAVLNPTSDGTVYSCNGCNSVFPDSYITIGGAAQGIVKFSSLSFPTDIAQATLSVNVYQLPFLASSILVYGYETAQSALSLSDVNAGTYLGAFTLPPGLQQGQELFLDVTSFVQAANAAYVAFSFRAEDAILLSSLEFNRGRPSQLSISVVPEPSTYLLWAVGMLGLFLWNSPTSRSRIEDAAGVP
jgi:hypothetical protein